MADLEQTRKQLLDRIEELIESQELEDLKKLLAESRSSDVAEVVEVVDEIARQILFDLLDPEDAGEVLEKIDEATRNQVAEELTDKVFAKIITTLPPDEAADVVAGLSDEKSEVILEYIPKEESRQIEKLLLYDEDTAGGIMTPDVVTVNIGDTIRDAIHSFREADPEEDYFYVFAVDDNGKYIGSLSMDTLLRYPRSTPILEMMDLEELVPIDVYADQEEIANIFRKNDLIVAPVVDRYGKLLGRITVDDIVDVMEEEAEEDVMVMAGTHPSELETRSVIRAATVRLPWLLTCMVGALLSAMIFIGIFEGYFSKPEWVCIIMFLPAIAAMGGNSGMQTSTIVVRGLATGDLAALEISQVFSREFRIALIVAVICACTAMAVSFAWLNWFPVKDFDLSDVPRIAFSVGMAMLTAILLSTLLGFILPYIFKKFGIDPAISSGPLVTTANDIISYLVYFNISFLMLKGLSG